MAQSKFRSFPVYLKGKKIATLAESTYDIESGDEPQFGAEGILGHSDGITTTKIECNVVVPVAGSPVGFLDAILGKQDVEVKIFADGKIQTITGRLTAANYTSNARNGEARGRFTFSGGAPDIA